MSISTGSGDSSERGRDVFFDSLGSPSVVTLSPSDLPIPPVDDQLDELERLLSDQTLAVASLQEADQTARPLLSPREPHQVAENAPDLLPPDYHPSAPNEAASPPSGSSPSTEDMEPQAAPKKAASVTQATRRSSDERNNREATRDDASLLQDALPPNVRPTPPIQPIELTPDEREEMAEGVTDEQRAALQAEVDNLYQQVVDILGPNQRKSNYALRLLKEARQIILAQPEGFAEAEYRVQQVKTLLLQRMESQQSGKRHGGLIFLYETLFLLIFMAVFYGTYLLQEPLASWLSKTTGASLDVGTLQAFFPLWSTFLWGGIGGAIGALYSLWWHVAQEQDFDRQYTLWYIAQPVMGVVLGSIIYLVISAGFLVLQVEPTFSQDAMGGWLGPALIACIAGFRQNFVYDLFSRIISTFTPKGEAEPEMEL